MALVSAGVLVLSIISDNAGSRNQLKIEIVFRGSGDITGPNVLVTRHLQAVLMGTHQMSLVMFQWFSEMEVCFCHVKIWDMTTHSYLYFLLFLCGWILSLGSFAQLSLKQWAERAVRLGCSPPRAVPRAEVMVYYGAIIQKLALQLLLVTIPHIHTRFGG